MAAYRRVYDSRYLQADCQESGSVPVIEYGLLYLFTSAESVTLLALLAAVRRAAAPY